MKFAIYIAFIFSFQSFLSQNNFFDHSDSLNKRRRNGVIITESLGAISSLALLNEVWYKPHKTSNFHFFNDGSEWLQMDKFGHTTTSYYIGIASIETLKWSGIKKNKAILFGGSIGLIYLSGVEILDGYSDKWGFSWYDMLANSSGSILAIGEELLWNEQRIKLKYSFHFTKYPTYRPNLLGSNKVEQLLKDYNGQTYWASINIKSFLKEQSHFPRWLNFAIGIGAEEMVSGEENSKWCNNNSVCDNLNRYRQAYLSLDLDLTQIHYKRKIFKTIFGTFGFIKIPSPTIEFSKHKVIGHWLYF